MQESGELEKAAVRGENNDRRYPPPVVLQWEDYSPLAQLVLRAGHTFEVNEEGKPFIRQLKAIDYTEEDIDFTTNGDKPSIGERLQGLRDLVAKVRKSCGR
jgi:hypothetical protein